MFLIDLLHFLCGYVEFYVYDGFGERFINLCSVHDIPLWDVTYQKDYFTARTTIKGYKKIPVCAKSSGVRVRKKESVGLPFILNSIKTRSGLAAGAVFFFILMSLLTSRVWTVEISGNEAIPHDIILSAAESSGLRYGIKTKDLDVLRLSLDICEKNNDISHAAIRVNGCCVYIDIKEASPPAKVENAKGQYNLVASKDAELVILEPYRGVPAIKTRNRVLKGDILINGTVLNRKEIPYFVHASGYAVGKTETKIESPVCKKIKAVNLISQKKAFFLNFFKLNLSFSKVPEKFSSAFTFKRQMFFNQKMLPIGFGFTEYFSVEPSDTVLSPAKGELIAICDFMESAFDFSKGKQIIESCASFSDNKSSFKGIFICYENIGIEIPFESDFNIIEQ